MYHPQLQPHHSLHICVTKPAATLSWSKSTEEKSHLCFRSSINLQHVMVWFIIWAQESPSSIQENWRSQQQTSWNHPMVFGISRDQDFIINMDQSPIPFTFDIQRTLEVACARTVCICKSTCDTKRATSAITITASGRMLTPVLVFKGTPEGPIATWYFHAYPCGCIYACKSLAWMD